MQPATLCSALPFAHRHDTKPRAGSELKYQIDSIAILRTFCWMCDVHRSRSEQQYAAAARAERAALGGYAA